MTAPAITRPTLSLREQIENAFDADTLIRYCEMHESEFAAHLGMERVHCPDNPVGDDFYLFKDNGSPILAVAHLDTVVQHVKRTTAVVMTAAGLVVHSGALDDRLGAYVLGDLLPRLGMKFDLLLTTGEESGASTAEYFEPGRHHERDYHWMIEFDRGGTDVVMYQYDDGPTRGLVRGSGARVADGIFSDIAFLEHLGVKGFNWGVGYQDYHSVRGHAYLDDTFKMVEHFCHFYQENGDTVLPHEPDPLDYSWVRFGKRRHSHDHDPDSVWADDETGECIEKGEDETWPCDESEGVIYTSDFGFLCVSHLDMYY